MLPHILETSSPHLKVYQTLGSKGKINFRTKDEIIRLELPLEALLTKIILPSI